MPTAVHLCAFDCIVRLRGKMSANTANNVCFLTEKETVIAPTGSAEYLQTFQSIVSVLLLQLRLSVGWRISSIMPKPLAIFGTNFDDLSDEERTLSRVVCKQME